MAKQYEGQIPFDKKGNLLTYPEWGIRAEDVVWKDNYTVKLELKFSNFQRGRSAAFSVWKSINTGLEFPMFLKDLGDMITKAPILGGEISGLFTFCKRGTSYGVKFLRTK